MPFPTKSLSQVESNDWQSFFEESKFSIWEYFGMVILNGNINFAWNIFMEKLIDHELKNQKVLLGI